MNEKTKEKGQSLVLVALMLVVLVGFVALAVDGGFSYLSRRNAQNAADAAALAGARELCRGEAESVVIARAEEYAQVRNQANAVTVEITGGNTVNVSTQINYNTFFAGILGFDIIDVNATAAAGCFNPCVAFGVVPVAFACKPPAGGEIEGDECGLKYPDPDESDPIKKLPLYIIMDSAKSNFVCQDPITGLPLDGINCEGTNVRLYGPGNRGWLYLSGGGGAADLKAWMLGGYKFALKINTWFPDKGGASTAVFKAAEEMIGKVVYVPLFNAICNGWPEDVCPSLYKTGDTVMGTKSNDSYYRVVSYNAFKITCVQDKIKDNKSDNCEAVQRLIDANPTISLKDYAQDMITGHFVTDASPDVTGACGESAPGGLSTIYLK